MESIKIWETEDYCKFEHELVKQIGQWKGNKYFPKKDGTSSWSNRYNMAFCLWGPAGSGKSEYLKIWMHKHMDNYSVQKITDLNQIDDEHEIFLFDGVNESDTFSEKKFEKEFKDRNIFLIFSGWDKTEIFSSYNINPSDEIVISIGWNDIKNDLFSSNFSIREKYLMCGVKRINKIKEKEFHSLIWKAFENIMTKAERDYYKKITAYNPIIIKNDSFSQIFQSLLKKHIIQWNEEAYNFVYSHPSIACYLFFRNHVESIKKLEFNDDIIRIITHSPSQLINWWVSLGKLKPIDDFFINNSIKISVKDHKIFDNHLKNDDIEYKTLGFTDLVLLSDQDRYQRMYSEYINENIKYDRELNINDINKKDIAYFIYSINAPSRGEENIPGIMNSMITTNFQNLIHWANDNPRQQMLNYVLGRYVQGYLDDGFSSLKISNLKSVLFSNWDPENQYIFFDFVKDQWNKIEKWFPNGGAQLAERFDGVLNSGRGRGSILDASSSYKKYDDRFCTGRNSMGNNMLEIGHRRVNFSMYLMFEHPVNKIDPFEMEEYYHKQYNGGPFHKGTEITLPFEKFMILLLNRYVYYSKNAPVPNAKFNHNIKVLPSALQNIFVSNNISEVFNVIWKFLQENNELLSLRWEIDKFIGKNGFNHIWIRAYNIYSIYDTEAHKKDDAVFSDEGSVYDPNGTFYNIRNGQEITVSKNKKFNKFIISYKLDEYPSMKMLDQSFIIDLRKKPELRLIEYKDITSWNISDENQLDFEYEKYENNLLDIYKNNK